MDSGELLLVWGGGGGGGGGGASARISCGNIILCSVKLFTETI